MLVGETREPFIAPTSTTESHPCPGIFHPQPPPAARVFRIHGLDQRLSPGKYRLLVRVHHQLLTGSREQATRGHGHDTMRALQVQHVEVCIELNLSVRTPATKQGANHLPCPLQRVSGSGTRVPNPDNT